MEHGLVVSVGWVGTMITYWDILHTRHRIEYQKQDGNDKSGK